MKCNEASPCDRCIRRGERCQRLSRSKGVVSISIPSMPTQPLFRQSNSTDAAVNLLHMKLFHHFQTFTRQTLMFVPDNWDRALQLCFEFDFLMNSILCVAARHLSTLQPDVATYPTAAASHLCRALSLFRSQLSDSLISIHIDAFIATSILLQYDIWSSTDFVSPQENGMLTFDASRDRIFTFASSLKEVFLKSVSHDSAKHSVFMQKHIQVDPTDVLVEAAQIGSATLAQYQDFFSYDRPLTQELLTIPFTYSRTAELVVSNPWRQHLPKSAPDPIDDGYLPVIRRLCLILSFLPESQPPQMADVDAPFFPQLVRYILSFPVMCHGPFSTMVQRSDPHALVLLYHFYRAANILLSPDLCWWAHKRAAMSEKLLKEWLIRNSADRTPH